MDVNIYDDTVLAKCTEFAVYCAQNHAVTDVPHANTVVISKVEPLKKKYTELFGSQPSVATIVKVVTSGCIVEVGPGLYVHNMALSMPVWVNRLLDHLGIEIELIEICGIRKTPAWRM